MSRRWVYTQGGRPLPEPVEVTDEWTDATTSTGDLGKFEYGVRMPDGTFVGDRHDYKRYLKATGTVPTSEFKGEWESSAKQREARARGERSDSEKRAHREAIGRAAYRKGLLK